MPTSTSKDFSLPQVRVIPTEDSWKYRVDLPLFFNDGDAVKVIVLQEADGTYTITDEGHTLMHLSYSKPAEEDFDTLKMALTALGIRNDNGRLKVERVDKDSLEDQIIYFAKTCVSLYEYM